ncbi:hypothetical protein [Nonomuraea turkmeniaca]|uniref:hypothetical protein n=1 Tax=Nonomuraea turkmeniaca TaxID=103838 RepID=UPI001B8790F4|nr:hypothetical protein [Nonomuraea turkmeniaca]
MPARQRRTLTLALSGAAAAALLVVAGAVVVQANSKQVPVVAVGESSQSTPGDGSGAGQPGEPPTTEETPAPFVPTETAAPVPTADIELPQETKKPKKTNEPIAQVPTPAETAAPRPQTSTKSPEPDPEPSPTPTKTKKGTNAVDPEAEPTTVPTSAPQSTDPPTVTPSRKPTSKPTATPKPNPYKPTSVCGSGYKVISSRALAHATIYLLYNATAGKNCVVTLSRLVYTGKVQMNAILQVKGGSSASNPGKFSAYAGPVRLLAKGKCVIWGGSLGSESWKSGWSHCK